MVAMVARAMTVGGSGASGWGNDDDGSFAAPSPSLLLSPPLSILSLSQYVGRRRRARRLVDCDDDDGGSSDAREDQRSRCASMMIVVCFGRGSGITSSGRHHCG